MELHDKSLCCRTFDGEQKHVIHDPVTMISNPASGSTKCSLSQEVKKEPLSRLQLVREGNCDRREGFPFTLPHDINTSNSTRLHVSRSQYRQVSFLRTSNLVIAFFDPRRVCDIHQPSTLNANNLRTAQNHQLLHLNH